MICTEGVPSSCGENLSSDSNQTETSRRGTNSAVSVHEADQRLGIYSVFKDGACCNDYYLYIQDKISIARSHAISVTWTPNC